MAETIEPIEGGCILLSRRIMQSEIWKKPPEYLKIFLYILLKVNHKDGLFPRGENFFNFSEERPFGVSKNQVYKFLQWAKSEDIKILATQKTTRGVVVKVNNYDKYQTMSNYGWQDVWQNRSRTDAKQKQNGINTINKNERMKECNNFYSGGKKEKNKFIPPSIEQIRSYCRSRKNSIDALKFYDFYESKGWKIGQNKMEDWKAMIRVWEKNEISGAQPYKNHGKTDWQAIYEQWGKECEENPADINLAKQKITFLER